MAKIFETLKFSLTQDEIDNGPAILVILEEPELFAQLLINRLQTLSSIQLSKYQINSFLQSFNEIDTEGLRRFAEEKGINLEFSILNSMVGTSSLHIRMKRTTIDFSLLRGLVYSFDARKKTCSQIIDSITDKIQKFVVRILKIKDEDDYATVRDDLVDEDYAYDFNLTSLSTGMIKLGYDEDSFSNNKTILRIEFTREWHEFLSFLSKEHNIRPEWKTNSLERSFKDLVVVIDKLEKACNNDDILIDEPTYDSSIKIHRSKLSREQIIERNASAINRFKTLYLSKKAEEQAIPDRKLIQLAFGQA